MLILVCFILSISTLVTGYFMLNENTADSLKKSGSKLAINSDTSSIIPTTLIKNESDSIKNINISGNQEINSKEVTENRKENVGDSQANINSSLTKTTQQNTLGNSEISNFSNVTNPTKSEKISTTATNTSSSQNALKLNNNISKGISIANTSKQNTQTANSENKNSDLNAITSSEKNTKTINASNAKGSAIANNAKTESVKTITEKNNLEKEAKIVSGKNSSSEKTLKTNTVNEQKKTEEPKVSDISKKDTIQNLAKTIVNDTLNNKLIKPREETKPTAQIAANITPTTTSDKPTKNQFSISTEVIYSTIKFSAAPNANAPSMYNQSGVNYPQMYSDGTTGNSYSLFSGAVSLGYSFKNSFGINLGAGFFNVETKINAKAFSQPITKSVFDYYLYDSSFQIIDTIYKPGATRNIIIVNGDTVEAQEYLNNIRFVTIPFSFSYKIGLSKKFSIEPHAGLQYAIPIKSNQLVALKPNVFEYSKNNLFMNPRSLFFDFALKINYKIGSNTNLYIKQGYFFNNKSIYNTDYILDYRLKNVYTSFGISILLK